MVTKNQFNIVPFTNLSGEVVHRVCGRRLDETQVRQSFKNFREALACKQALELEAIDIEQRVSLKATLSHCYGTLRR
jgi:hypothetical protein